MLPLLIEGAKGGRTISDKVQESMVKNEWYCLGKCNRSLIW